MFENISRRVASRDKFRPQDYKKWPCTAPRHIAQFRFSEKGALSDLSFLRTKNSTFLISRVLCCVVLCRVVLCDVVSCEIVLCSVAFCCVLCCRFGDIFLTILDVMFMTFLTFFSFICRRRREGVVRGSSQTIQIYSTQRRTVVRFLVR